MPNQEEQIDSSSSTTDHKNTVHELCNLLEKNNIGKVVFQSRKVINFFVYGSLRPDDDSGMPWTDQAVEGLKSTPGTIKNCQLF